MSQSVRLLPDAVADGPTNMARDEILLETAVAGAASLRFYGWSEPTLSLGYFQPEHLRSTDERLATLPLVRRASGGDALVHHHEVTYALALPAGAEWHGRDTCLLCLHRVLAAALASLGVQVKLHVAVDEPPFRGVLCFLHHTSGDLILESHKIAGSAQRKQRGAMLQHGALLLHRSQHTPELPGIRDLTGRDLGFADVISAVCREFERETKWDLNKSDWTDAELQRIDALATGKYNRDAWNRKR